MPQKNLHKYRAQHLDKVVVLKPLSKSSKLVVDVLPEYTKSTGCTILCTRKSSMRSNCRSMAGEMKNQCLHNRHLRGLRKCRISLMQTKKLFPLGDSRKFSEQHERRDRIGSSNRAYAMTHGVSGIDWKHCKHPLPEHVNEVCIEYRECDRVARRQNKLLIVRRWYSFEAFSGTERLLSYRTYTTERRVLYKHECLQFQNRQL